MENLDETDRELLAALAEDARISLKELAGRIGLSSPSTSERMRRLEERGVIKGYTIEVDAIALGYQLQAIVRIKPLPGKLHIAEQKIEAIPQFCECDKVTGDDCFVARLYIKTIAELDPLLESLRDIAETNTSIVKSKPFARRLPPLR